MLNLTVALRRLLTRTPPKGAIAYAWWYVLGGRTTWALSGGERMARRKECAMAKLLETWDTATYRAWVNGEGPGGDPMVFPAGTPSAFSAICRIAAHVTSVGKEVK